MEGPQNKGTLMEPTLGLLERRVRLEYHMLELLELERDYLAKKERLLEKVEPLLEECGLPERRTIERGKREGGEGGAKAKKRTELTGDEIGNITRQVAGGVIRTWEQLYASIPGVTKATMKKFGSDLKMAGVWVPKAEVKKPKTSNGEAKGAAAAGAAADAKPAKKKKKTAE